MKATSDSPSHSHPQTVSVVVCVAKERQKTVAWFRRAAKTLLASDTDTLPWSGMFAIKTLTHPFTPFGPYCASLQWYGTVALLAYRCATFSPDKVAGAISHVTFCWVVLV